MTPHEYLQTRSVNGLARDLGTPRTHARRLRSGECPITPAMLERLRRLEPRIQTSRAPLEIYKFAASHFGADEFSTPTPEQMEGFRLFLGLRPEEVD